MSTPLLEVTDLRVDFVTTDGDAHRAVDGFSLSVRRGEIVALVGESGSGKSVTALSVMGLLPAGGRVTGGAVRFDGEELLGLPGPALRTIRGRRIAMVFQDPMTSLNPVMTIGAQVREALRLHQPGLGRRAANTRAVELLTTVGIPQAARRLRDFPHVLSGGMRQRVMIAIARANEPDLLIADEPTTALDVTVQAQVLRLLRGSGLSTGAATLLITHDLGVVAQFADRVVVMYAGRLAETATVQDLFRQPSHPYTRGLLASLPSAASEPGTLPSIPGAPPVRGLGAPGCPFAPRCPLATDLCREQTPPVRDLGEGHRAACHYVGSAA